VQVHRRGIAALCVVGLSLIGSCGGGGGGGGADLDDPAGVAGPKGATGGGPAAPSSAPGATAGAAPSSAPGAAPSSAPGATAGAAPSSAPGATAGAAGASPAAAATPGAAGASPGAAGPAASPAAGAAPAASGAAGTIVPLYTYPTDPSWNTVIAAKAAHPAVDVIAVVNPNNGPGAAADPGYASGIARLNAAGIGVVGYVATGYAANSAAAVKADMDRWKAFYPGQISGIFFDEQSNKAGDVAYYRDLSQHAKAQGMPFTIGNPGTDTAEAFVGALDVMLIYESAGLPTMTQLGGWHANHAPSNFGVIPHAANLDAAFVREARRYVDYIYVQNDTLPNPWDSVPANFGDLLAALE
jgi:hypothetical protein